MKWLGALLVFAASTWAGLKKVVDLKREIRVIDKLVPFISLIQRELQQRGTPLPEILRCAVEQGLLNEHLFETLSAKLRAGEPISRAAERELIKLPPNIVQRLHALCGVLGRYDSVTQCAACSQAIEQLNTYKESLIKELMLKGRLYGMIPITCGLMVIMLLF